MLDARAEAVSFYAPEDDLSAQFAYSYEEIPRVQTLKEILEDESIQLILNTGIPAERAAMGIKVMLHGKDYMVDKPGLTILDQLEDVRQLQVETGRIYSVCYSERFWSRAATKADELNQAGAIWKGEGGGVLLNQCPHNLDLFQWFVGMPKRVAGFAAIGKYHYI